MRLVETQFDECTQADVGNRESGDEVFNDFEVCWSRQALPWHRIHHRTYHVLPETAI
jgi:hypothetical protein